ncbi:MAG: hypothetical protein KF850_32655 [Labilithrix sp.]|nr:hypothetical protein [Labilithrix sp.]MBX3216831.1 hypothetical protein [Labilithrix sp.]
MLGFPSVHGILGAALIVCITGCASSPEGEEPDPGPALDAEPALTFGEAGDTAASNGAELFSKPPSNPNPKTLSGIYERTGYASENRERDFLVVSNDWRTRLELRDSKVVAATECTIQVGGAVDETKTIFAYVSSPLTVEPWGVRIEAARKDTETWAEYDVGCGVEISDESWPYCLGTNLTIPDGYSMCIYLDKSLQLSVKKSDGSSGTLGTKIRN